MFIFVVNMRSIGRKGVCANNMLIKNH